MIGKAIYRRKNYNAYNDFHLKKKNVCRLFTMPGRCVIINGNCKWVISTHTIN